MLSLNIINEKMSKLDNWALEGNSITKDFRFGTFKGALEFINKIGEIAEKLNHHPDITLSNNLVRLSLTTHIENGLTSMDFELAEEIDKAR